MRKNEVKQTNKQIVHAILYCKKWGIGTVELTVAQDHNPEVSGWNDEKKLIKLSIP